ncbi:PepSY-associated TM helix domain-containing protein [Altericroceibacterium indicum]|uniref:PepSY-associated TM helix domain-containing protein n=1 Tax=Altericroceibacterium indicum TaxID=374177 RepID=UPI003CCD5647
MNQPASRASSKRRKPGKSAFWKKQFHTWHWMSSAIALVGMVLFAFTGITLNHAASIEGSPIITTHEDVLPASVLRTLEAVPADANSDVAPPKAVSDWLVKELHININARAPEWSDTELYIPLPKAGGDGWVSINRTSGEVVYENTDRGWIAYLNDLHKGRDTGAAWSWFIDIFAAACIVFCLTGLLLLQIHSKRRRSTWPIVGAGVLIPLFLLIFMMH